MISEILNALLEFVKLAPRYLIAFGIASAFLLFSPDTLLTRLGLLEFTQTYRPWLALVLIVTAALFVVTVVGDTMNWFRRRRSVAAASRHLIRRLHSLREDEKQILRFYIAKQTRTNKLRIDDGVVQGLAADGIVFLAAPVGHFFDGIAYNITDEAWDYLQLHPELLKGTTNTYRTDGSS